MPSAKLGKATEAATRTPGQGGDMDERLMVKVKDQVPPITLECEGCGQKHIFRYSHLKLDEGRRYSVFVGVPCFTEHLEEITSK